MILVYWIKILNFSLTFSFYILPILRVVLQNMLDCARKLSMCMVESHTLPTGIPNLFNIQSPIQLTPPTFFFFTEKVELHQRYMFIFSWIVQFSNYKRCHFFYSNEPKEDWLTKLPYLAHFEPIFKLINKTVSCKMQCTTCWLRLLKFHVATRCPKHVKP